MLISFKVAPRIFSRRANTCVAYQNKLLEKKNDQNNFRYQLARNRNGSRRSSCFNETNDAYGNEANAPHGGEMSQRHDDVAPQMHGKT